MSDYVNRHELLKEIKNSKELDCLTPRALELLMKMIKKCTQALRYKNNMDKEDCMSEATFDIIKYWKRFDPNIPNSNCFSFYTQMIKNGLAKGWKKCHNIKTINVVSINDETGIYNI